MVQNENSSIVSDHGNYPGNMKVHDLILEDYTGWKGTLARQVHGNVEANRVLTIPFSIHHEDTLALKFE